MPRGDHERRISDLESRVDAVEGEAQAARILSTSADREQASLAVEMRSVKRMLSAHVQQTEERFAQMRTEFAHVHGKLADVDGQLADLNGKLVDVNGRLTDVDTGVRTIVSTLDRLIDRDK